MAEITRKSVLLECLSIMREEQRICSKGYNGLEPAKGMEEAWEQGRKKITILEDIIHALDSDMVLSALAGWQREVARSGPPKEIETDFRVLKESKAFQELRKELAKDDTLDHEDGTMELR